MQIKKYKIFTFFDFLNGIPPYLNLCINTWKKYFGIDVEIVLLDRNNVKNYIDSYLLTESVTCPFKPENQMYYDYMALLVLYCNGGLFLDADTIITDNFELDFSLLNNHEAVAFSDINTGVCCGFLMAQKYSTLLGEMIRRYRFENYLPQRKIARNSIIQDVFNNCNNNKIFLYDAISSGYLTEAKCCGAFSKTIYRDFYFSNKISVEKFLKHAGGIVALHHSLTPKKFQKMSEGIFLKQDIMLSKIFKILL